MEQPQATTEDQQGSNAATVASTAQPTETTVQDIEKKVFPPEMLNEATSYIQEVIAIAEKENIEPVFNFDPAGDFPEGYGISVIPLTKRVAERGNLTYGIVIAAVPTVETLANDEAGANYISKIVTDNLLRQISAGAKPKDEGAQISIPFKVSEFVTTSRTSGLAAFNAVASDYVKALKTKGLKFMSKVLLRQVLASAAFAEQQFPRLSQENWQLVLDSMVAHVKQKGMEAGVLGHWKNTRDTVEIDTSDIDLADIDDILA